MAIAGNAVGDFLSRAVCPAGDFTWMAWLYMPADSSVARALAYFTNSGDTVYIRLRLSSADKLGLSTQLGGNVGTITVTAGSWHHLALTRSGTTKRGLLNGVLEVANTDAANPTLDHMQLFSDGAIFVDGRFAAEKFWSTVLTDAEILNEMYSYVPRRTADLWAWEAMISVDDLRDLSGNGRDYTANGTLATGDGPPIPWGPVPSQRYYVAPAGGSTQPPRTMHQARMRAA